MWPTVAEDCSGPSADGLQPKVHSLVAVFAGEHPPAALLKRSSRIRILTARHEAIDIHYPLHTTFLCAPLAECAVSHVKCSHAYFWN